MIDEAIKMGFVIEKLEESRVLLRFTVLVRRCNRPILPMDYCDPNPQSVLNRTLDNIYGKVGEEVPEREWVDFKNLNREYLENLRKTRYYM